MESNSVCCHCRHIPATHFCICRPSLLTFCASCEGKHKAQSGFHYPLSLPYRVNIRPESLFILRSRLEYLSIAQTALMDSLGDFEKCEDELNRKFTAATELLEKERNRQLQSLRAFRNQVTEHITAAIEETKANCMNEKYLPTLYFANEIWQLAQRRINTPVSLLSYRVNLEQGIVPTCVEVQVEVKVTDQASDRRSQIEQVAYPPWSMRKGLDIGTDRSGLLDVSRLIEVAELYDTLPTSPIDPGNRQRAVEIGIDYGRSQQSPSILSSQSTFPIPAARRQNWTCGFCGIGLYSEDVTICSHCQQPKSEQGEVAYQRDSETSAHSDSRIEAVIFSPPVSNPSYREQFESFAPQVASRSGLQGTEELQGRRNAIPTFSCRIGMQEMQKPIRPS